VKSHEIESWVLDIIDRVKTGQPIEDSRVELKSEWIPPEQAARKIAGHANAARGENILWIIGVDEKGKKISDADIKDLADWYPQLEKQFDGLAPKLLTDLNIPVEEKTVVALLFETDRAPFVVKNPKGGSPELEVPWREGTRTKSATRSDLIRLLSPIQKLPKFEVLNGSLTSDIKENFFSLKISLRMYVTIRSEAKIIIPFHQCQASFFIPECIEQTNFNKLNLKPTGEDVHIPIGKEPSASSMSRSSGADTILKKVFRSSSLTIDKSETQVIISGPDILFLEAEGTDVDIKSCDPSSLQNIQVFATFLPVDAESSVSISAAFQRKNESDKWVLKI
jgi:hypothetical protein